MRSHITWGWLCTSARGSGDTSGGEHSCSSPWRQWCTAVLAHPGSPLGGSAHTSGCRWSGTLAWDRNIPSNCHHYIYDYSLPLDLTGDVPALLFGDHSTFVPWLVVTLLLGHLNIDWLSICLFIWSKYSASCQEEDYGKYSLMTRQDNEYYGIFEEKRSKILIVKTNNYLNCSHEKF